MKKNPFSLSFGKEPVSLINRNVQSYEIIDTFEDENPAYQVCMITGVRGSGKTVMLTEINKTFRAEEDWIVIDLNPHVSEYYDHGAVIEGEVKSGLMQNIQGELLPQFVRGFS